MTPDLNPNESPQALNRTASPPRPLIAYIHLVIMGFLAQMFCLGYYWVAKPTIWHEAVINPNLVFTQACMMIAWINTALLIFRVSMLTQTLWLRSLQIAFLVILAGSATLIVLFAAIK
jgi:hypothetical protein